MTLDQFAFVPMASFTLKLSSKLRSVLHYINSIVIRCFSPIANTVCFKNSKLIINNHYNSGFRNTFHHKHCMCSVYLLLTVTASGHIVP